MFWFFGFPYSNNELIEQLDKIQAALSALKLDWKIIGLNKYYPHHFVCSIPGNEGMPCYCLLKDKGINYTGEMINFEKAVDYIQIRDLT